MNKKIEKSDISVRFIDHSNHCLYFNDDSFDELEDEARSHKIEAKIYLEDDVIGHMHIRKVWNGNNFFYDCDDECDDLTNLADHFSGKRGSVLPRYLPKDKWVPYVTILKQIEINPEYRGLGIGRLIMSNLSSMMEYEFETPVVLLQASAYEVGHSSVGFDSPEFHDATNKLRKFYESCGFKHAKDNFMYIN